MVGEKVLDKRNILAPFVGRRVTVTRAVVMRDGISTEAFDRHRPTTLLGFVRVAEAGGGECGGHVWLHGTQMVRPRYANPGDVVTFTAAVRCYTSRDPATGKPMTRYGLHEPGPVVRVGPANLIHLCREMAEIWGWDDLELVVRAVKPRPAVKAS